MKHYRKLAIVILILLGIIGCATSITNLNPLYLYGKPSVTCRKDSEVDWSKYKTFSIFPFSLLNKECVLDPIAQKQVLFYMRCLLEDKGYKFVKPDEKPDFCVTVNFNCKYETSYIPPSSVTVPHYIPGKTITTYQNNSGNIRTYGDMNIWGTYSGQSTSTTYIPGTLTTRTYTQSGYTVGYYYPYAMVLVYDGKTEQEIYSATGAGTSDNGDFRISGQPVLGVMFEVFPPCKEPAFSKPAGYLGIAYRILTIDGNNYFPAIMIGTRDSPAKRSGLKEEDIITAINGEPTVNKSWFQIWEMIDGPEGTEINFKIWRVNKNIDVKVIKGKRPAESQK